MTFRYLHQKGFTLLEVLVAIAVFSMVALVSYSTLDTYLDHRERLSTHYGKLERLQRLFILLERDIQFAINRPVRNDGDHQPAIMSADGDDFITLSVAEADINSATGVSLKRVQWRLEGKEMMRVSWDVLDQNGNAEESELVVNDDIQQIELNYYLYQANKGVQIKTDLDADEFPDGVEVLIQLESGEQYRRLFGVARSG